MDKADTIMSVAQEIEQYPNLLGVVLYTHLGQNMEDKNVIIQEHAISIKMVNSIARHTVFVYNHSYAGKVCSETIRRIKSCIY